MAGCDLCVKYATQISIKSPSKLSNVILMAKEAVSSGALIVIDSKEEKYSRSFSELGPDGCWDDIVNHRFICPCCGATFELFADTYHGGNLNAWYFGGFKSESDSSS